MRKFIPYIPVFLLCIVAIVSVSFSEKERTKQTCTNVIIKIEKGKIKNQFIVEKDVFAYLKTTKKALIGKKIKDINIHDIEDNLENNPSVLSCETYVTLDGELNIKITQRTPLVRVISIMDSYYIDENGRLMPLSSNYSSRCVVASGQIFEGFRKKINVLVETPKAGSCLKDLYDLTLAIKQDTLLNSLIEQIYVTASREYILISKVGPSKIEFGKAEFYETKLNNLKAFYESPKVRENWHLYETISIKYQNQIVCTKIKI